LQDPLISFFEAILHKIANQNKLKILLQSCIKSFLDKQFVKILALSKQLVILTPTVKNNNNRFVNKLDVTNINIIMIKNVINEHQFFS